MQTLSESIIMDWLGPIFLLLVAALSIMFIVKKQWISALSFAGLAIVVGVFIFGGDALFGDGGNLQQVGVDLSGEIGAN